MLEVTNDTNVYTAHDEHVGSIDRVVLDPITRRMSHVVVRKGLFFPEDKLIPVEDIATATPQRVNLRLDVDADGLQPFIEQHYVPFESADRPTDPTDRPLAFSSTWYGPVGLIEPMPADAMASVSERNIPDRLAAVEVGVPVLASGHEIIGRFERLVTDDAGFPARIVVKSGSLLSTRLALPISWVADITEEAISLAVTTRTIEAVEPLEGNA